MLSPRLNFMIWACNVSLLAFIVCLHLGYAQRGARGFRIASDRAEIVLEREESTCGPSLCNCTLADPQPRDEQTTYGAFILAFVASLPAVALMFSSKPRRSVDSASDSTRFSIHDLDALRETAHADLFQTRSCSEFNFTQDMIAALENTLDMDETTRKAIQAVVRRIENTM